MEFTNNDLSIFRFTVSLKDDIKTLFENDKPDLNGISNLLRITFNYEDTRKPKNKEVLRRKWAILTGVFLYFAGVEYGEIDYPMWENKIKIMRPIVAITKQIQRQREPAYRKIVCVNVCDPLYLDFVTRMFYGGGATNLDVATIAAFAYIVNYFEKELI